MMTLSILADNRSLDTERFRSEHGLSVLLQTGSRSILLDTGASGLFLDNARELGLDIQGVDYVFVSHGHADHAGGLARFLEANGKARILLSPEAVSERFWSLRGGRHCISPDWPLEQMEGRTIWVDETLELGEGLRVIAAIAHSHALPRGNRQLLSERKGECGPDEFRHELAIYIDGLLFTGCAHSGLLNILEACPWPVHTVLGGFHLLDPRGGEVYESREELLALAEKLHGSYPDTLFYTSHCTGDEAFATLRSVMGERLRHFFCGGQIEISGKSLHF